MSYCFSSSREKTISFFGAYSASARCTKRRPNEPVPPVTSTTLPSSTLAFGANERAETPLLGKGASRERANHSAPSWPKPAFPARGERRPESGEVVGPALFQRAFERRPRVQPVQIGDQVGIGGQLAEGPGHLHDETDLQI